MQHQEEKKDKIIEEAFDDLVAILLKNGFLYSTDVKDQYEITSMITTSTTTVAGVTSGSTIKSHTKEENDFLMEVRKFRTIAFIYTKLYVTYSSDKFTEISSFTEFEHMMDQIIDKQNFSEVMSPEIVESYKTIWRDMYETVLEGTDMSPREKLEVMTREIEFINNLNLRNFVRLIESIIKHKERFGNDSSIRSLKFEQFQEFDLIPSASIKERVAAGS